MNKCLFCNSNGPFNRIEHIIPEALGNDDLILVNEVCDNCNQYFGKEIEKFALEKTPIAFWRTYLGLKNKKNKLPHIDLSLDNRKKGTFKNISPLHDNFISFTCHEDYSVSAEINNEEIVKQILQGRKKHFTFAFTPKILSIMGRFLCKIGVELICLSNTILAKSEKFSMARQFARFGNFDGLWPIFHLKSNNISDLKQYREDSQGVFEEVFCYHYNIFDIADIYTVFSFTVGTDTWIITLNDPYPTPIIRCAFPDQEMKLIWYGPEQRK